MATGRPREASIIAASAKLFRQRGYQGTTMDDISAAVKLNKGTLYHYFNSKSDLLERIYAESIEMVLESFAAHEDDLSAAERLRQVLLDLARAVDRAPNHTVVYLQEMQWLDKWLPRKQYAALRAREDELRDYVVRTIAEGVKSGEFEKCDPFLAAMAVLGMVCWTYRWYAPNGRLQIDDIGSTYGDIALLGLLRR